MKKLRSKIYLVIIMAFLYLPIIYLIAYSFNDGKTSVWKGFTWKWYEALFQDAQIMGSLKNTLIVAILASVIATILGTAAAIGIYNFKGGVRSAIQNVSNIPIINPEIVTGVSLMLLFTFAGVMMGFEMGFWTVLLAHIGFCTPYVILSVTPRIRQMDSSLYEAALDLGATPASALFRVVLPQIFPGMVSGFSLAVTLSLDDYFIATYTKPATFDTISTYVVNATKGSQTAIKTALWALSTLIFVIVILIVVGMSVKSSREEAEKRRKEAAR
jgi:spermidine/putrescine transport system permease protein